ncbi:MAG: hypothetical protein K5905_04360 [Roseibium sp.]|uniref:hypothetical protein n=1 Tax=Roseibium sp. TaxID=1936156 RepID=UPI002612F863|nr:hypothetical protein [Roseibium sp.]MCV0424682.1 hypothetical protein [Roseibium sp.]
MANYSKQMQKIVSEYRVAGQPWPASSKAIAAWAISTDRWQLGEEAAVKKCAEDISRAMREEYTTDPKGRRVRLKHSATVLKGGEQYVLWDDIRTAPRSHMQMAFQQRRNQIFGDCKQLKADVDSYNDSHLAETPIQMIFDFTLDLEEEEAA